MQQIKGIRGRWKEDKVKYLVVIPNNEFYQYKHNKEKLNPTISYRTKYHCKKHTQNNSPWLILLIVTDATEQITEIKKSFFITHIPFLVTWLAVMESLQINLRRFKSYFCTTIVILPTERRQKTDGLMLLFRSLWKLALLFYKCTTTMLVILFWLCEKILKRALVPHYLITENAIWNVIHHDILDFIGNEI